MLTSGLTNANALLLFSKSFKASTLSQVDIADSISDDYSNKSKFY